MATFKEEVAKFNKKYGEELITQGIKAMDAETIPFSSIFLNYMLHGGFQEVGLLNFLVQRVGVKLPLPLMLL